MAGASHHFANKRVLLPELIAKIPGLPELCSPEERDEKGLNVLGCSAGCGYHEVVFKPFWVDPSRLVVQHDTRNTPCSAPGKGGGTAAGGSATSQPKVAHPRVDMSTVIPKAGASLKVPGTTFLKDERLGRFLSGPKRSALLDSHESVPDTFRAHALRLMVLVSEVQATIAAGKAAASRSFKPRTPSSPFTSGPAASSSSASVSTGVRHTSSSSSTTTIADLAVPVSLLLRDAQSKEIPVELAKATVTFGTLERNELALAIMSRGLHEYLSWSTYVAWSGSYGKIKAAPLLRELHDNLLPDMAVVSDAILKGTAISSSLTAVWDGSTFFILGALVMKRDDSAISAFYRVERNRLDAICAKKFGWKPPSASAASAAADDGPAIASAGDRAGDGEGQQDEDEGPNPSGPRGRKRGRPGGGGGKGIPAIDKPGAAKKLRGAQQQVRQLQSQLAKLKAGNGGGDKPTAGGGATKTE